MQHTCATCGVSFGSTRKYDYACVPCARKRAKRYRDDHPDRMKAQRAKYYAKPGVKELRSENRKQWRQANPDEAKAKDRARYLRHRAYYLARMEAIRGGKKPRKRRLVDGMKLQCGKCRKMLPRGTFSKCFSTRLQKMIYLSYCRDCRKPYSLVRGAIRRTLKRGSGGSFKTSDVEKLRAMQKDRCAICRKPMNGVYHIDHIIPVSKGGSSWPSNLQLTHPVCNMRKSAKVLTLL